MHYPSPVSILSVCIDDDIVLFLGPHTTPDVRPQMVDPTLTALLASAPCASLTAHLNVEVLCCKAPVLGTILFDDPVHGDIACSESVGNISIVYFSCVLAIMNEATHACSTVSSSGLQLPLRKVLFCSCRSMITVWR